MEVIAEAGIERIRAKGQPLTDLLVRLADEWLAPYGFVLASPRDGARRGAHISLRHPNAKEFVRALIAQGITPDFRPPDMIRFGPAPLYTRFVDVWDAIDRLRQLCAYGNTCRREVKSECPQIGTKRPSALRLRKLVGRFDLLPKVPGNSGVTQGRLLKLSRTEVELQVSAPKCLAWRELLG